VPVSTIQLLEQAIITKDHTELLISATQVRHELQHTLFDSHSVDGHSPLTIVYTDSHTNMKRPSMG